MKQNTKIDPDMFKNLWDKAMEDPVISKVPKNEVADYIKEILSMTEEERLIALLTDDLEVLSESKDYLEFTLGCEVEICSADFIDKGDDPKNKSKQVKPGRPAIYIE